MPRPRKCRRVCSLPECSRFGPQGCRWDPELAIVMTVDEYETIRLIDGEGMTQEECAARMNVARTTVQGIYDAARKKVADALVNGKPMLIEGGDYSLCDGNGCGGGCGRRRGGDADPD